MIARPVAIVVNLDLVVKTLALGAPIGILIGAAHEYAYAAELFGRFISVYDAADLVRVALEYLVVLFAIPLIGLVIEVLSRKFGMGFLDTALDATRYRLYVAASYVGLAIWFLLFLFKYQRYFSDVSQGLSTVVFITILATVLRMLMTRDLRLSANIFVLLILYCALSGASEARSDLTNNKMTDVIQIKDDVLWFGRILRVLNKGIVFRNSNSEIVFITWGEVKSFKVNLGYK
jgi:hypothetical protein